MPSFGSHRGDVLYLIVCAAPPARHATGSVALLQEAEWDVCVVATPAALAWIDIDGLHAITGHAVRSDFRGPDEPEFDPRGDAVLVAPATFNTINRCAAGLNDSLGLGLMNEALGAGSIPIALVPWVNASLADHPAYESSLLRLKSARAHIVQPDGHEPKAFDVALLAASRWIARQSRVTPPG